MGVGDWLSKGLDIIAPPVGSKPIPKPAEEKTVTSRVVETSSVNQEIYEEVTKNLLQRGKVFNDFNAKVKSVEDVIPDTAQRFKAMSKSMGVGKDVLISALTEQRTGINSELKKFEDDMAGLESKASQTKEEIETYVKGIQTLQSELEKLQTKKDEVEGKLSKQAAQIAQIREQFGSTIKFIEAEYDKMERDLNLYIK